MPVSGLALAKGYPHSVMTAPTTPGLQAVGVPPLALPPLPPPPIATAPESQLPVLALQHMPPVQVSPGLHLFIGWHEHPSDPGMHSVVSTVPEAPAGITQAPAVQTPLAQSGPALQVVFGSGTLGMHSPPVHVPLWQSLAWAQDEPARTPVLAPPELEPPLDVEPASDVAPPLDVERSPPRFNPSEPPEPPSIDV
jgi:hypothetical protein